MNRNFIVSVASSILLFIAIMIWQELFIFQKTTINHPAWAKALPYPMMAAHFLVVIALMPLAIKSKSNFSFIKSISTVSIVSPVLAMIALAFINNASASFNSFTNNLIWVVGVNCIPATLLIIISRAIFDIISSKRANNAFKRDAKQRAPLN